MEKRIIKINKEDLKLFFIFVKENDIKFKDKVKVFTSDIYFNNSNSNYISWNVDELTEKSIKILIEMINRILLNCELKYTRRRK